ncbi:MAG: S-ribosylhomocysteine lyase [Agathobaculum sp.]|uniref:S-ribosylhomocysteine lyase n=1 Tax=Agathobaculum sp. TaxID=2048138 RepID=UPI0025BA0B1E|nr:S-ribosylhomocysteine lyase [Agathobaculum sp.]MCI7124709.1 S-ribosylhomocysteine lyase [Agathobaculum sp.]MDY3711150.1 S-ribosylhomocysteine lyase [Agathobaculum sp.]
MKRIASFAVNHDKLKPGMYTSRIDGDVTTYDIRMVYPNAGTYIDPAAGHTFEHLFATYARNSRFEDKIIYCGPMGCQTGFYFLVRDFAPRDAIELVRETMDFVAAFEGEIPGASRVECGNYKLHDLAGAKRLAASMQPVLRDWTEEKLVYEK